MSKTKKTPKAAKAAKKSAQRWSLGVYESAKNPGQLIAVYCRVDGTVMKSYRHAVTTAKAKFNAQYSGVTYAAARAQLFKDAAKAGVKPPTKEEEKKENPKQVRRAA